MNSGVFVSQFTEEGDAVLNNQVLTTLQYLFINDHYLNLLVCFIICNYLFYQQGVENSSLLIQKSSLLEFLTVDKEAIPALGYKLPIQEAFTKFCFDMNNKEEKENEDVDEILQYVKNVDSYLYAFYDNIHNLLTTSDDETKVHFV